MAHYVPIPKDLNDIKEKFIMGFTKRQVICFGIGLVLGAPVYFLTRASIGMSGAIFAMGAVAAPAILCGIYKKNGVFLEKQVKFMREYFTRPRKRSVSAVSSPLRFGRSQAMVNLQRRFSPMVLISGSAVNLPATKNLFNIGFTSLSWFRVSVFLLCFYYT